MFRSLDALESSMYSILKHLISTNSLPPVNDDRDMRYALFCCCEKGYILNLPHNQNMDADYLFDTTANVLVSDNGLRFLKDKSLLNRIKLGIFDILRGTLGFILGVLSTALATYLGSHIEEIGELLTTLLSALK